MISEQVNDIRKATNIHIAKRYYKVILAESISFNQKLT